MNKLIKEVKNELATRAVREEKAKIKLMLELIDSKKQQENALSEEIHSLKAQLEKRDYRAVKIEAFDWVWTPGYKGSASEMGEIIRRF